MKRLISLAKCRKYHHDYHEDAMSDAPKKGPHSNPQTLHIELTKIKQK